MIYYRLQKKCFYFATLFLFLTGFFSCSSAPKKPLEIFTSRNAAYAQIELANSAISKNNYSTAQIHITEAWRLAVSCDDSDLRIRVLLCKGNALFNQGEANKAEEAWVLALNEALVEKNSVMTSASQVHMARVVLSKGKAEEARNLATESLSTLKSEPLFTAQAWRVIGLSEKELGHSKEAETAFLQAEKIHVKNNYLEEAAYDWYLIASSRSKAGQYALSIEALHKALEFDRRCENSLAIGMDWQSIGVVLEKSGNTEKAKEAYDRSAAIFTAAGFIENAKESIEKRKSITNSPLD